MSGIHGDQPDWLNGQVPPSSVGNPNWKRGGTSPNPKGRPPGPSKQQKLMNRMLDEGAEVLDAVLENAKTGDPASAGLVLNRILPTLRSQSQMVQFELDPALPITRQVEQVLAAVAAGQVPPDIAQQITTIIGTLSSVRATEELERRIAELEGKAESK
jgi:hypothetical protein